MKDLKLQFRDAHPRIHWGCRKHIFHFLMFVSGVQMLLNATQNADEILLK
jgi:hypothetical protein